MDQIYLLQKQLVNIIYKQFTMTYTRPVFLFINITSSFAMQIQIVFNCLQNFLLDPNSHHNYLTRVSQHNLQSPSSATAAGHRRASYRCTSLWNDCRIEFALLGWRRALGMP